ncbi:MAG: DUF2147 domain-containing protein [Saprospiraceae bacterium]|nr:DUF2147 domain-containing protein [Saprospiraceae bacterium]|tara:strand:+ start:774 stop:1196 length:423 start_codon:yes stop_codon:yes gene_type:complete
MKFISIILFGLIFSNVSAQESVFGIWKAIDDKDGEPSSYIEIYKKEGRAYGKITKLFDQTDDILCEKCPGDKKNTPVLGLEMLWDMKQKGKEWNGGRILDPEDGNTYKCVIGLNKDGTLKVRGYIGIRALGRTQTWHRVS